MTNKPIPRRGLLGAWFLTDRGITYNVGADEAIDRSGKGNHATYRNGVTVGTAGDPSRDFGAANFDAGSNQFAEVDDPLAVDGPQAVVLICKPNVLDGNARFAFSNGQFSATGLFLGVATTDEFRFSIPDGQGDPQAVGVDDIQAKEYVSIVGFFDGSQIGIYADGSLRDTGAITSVTAGSANATIGSDVNETLHWDGEIAAVGRYDLTVPNAPEPSEIARKWDRLTDIPATR